MTFATNEAGFERDLLAVCGEDERFAKEAFERLWLATRQATERQIRRRGISADDVGDVSQTVYAQLWRARRSIRARSLGSWYALVRKTAARLLQAHWGGARPEAGEVLPDVEAAEEPYLDAMVRAAQSRRLFDAADRLWLGETLAEDADMGVAVLRLLLAEELGRNDLCEMFAVVPQDVERWLADPGVLARALFAALCWPNAELAGYVLRPERPLGERDLDRISKGYDVAEDGLSWEACEARVVLWRVRNALLVDQIQPLADGMERALIEDAIRRACDAYPFRRIAASLNNILGDAGATKALANPGLWKRIAFEYHFQGGLPQKQIVERAGPPAEEGSFRLVEKTVANWLSSGRIYSQLAASLTEDLE